MAKSSHATAHYRQGSDAEHCGNCKHHSGTNPMHCSEVVDPISSPMKCNWWTKEPAGMSNEGRTLIPLTLSAQTARLASTPAPYGRPGGPGLYGVKGNKHSDYFEHVVQALMRNGKSKAAASRIAWAALRKWRSKSKRPEVKAAASGALRQESAAASRARGHANDHNALEFVWVGLGRGRGWRWVGPVQGTTPGQTRPGATQQAPNRRPPAGGPRPPGGKGQLPQLRQRLGQVNLAIKAANAAIVADKQAKTAAAQALAAQKAWLAGGFTTTGGSKATGSSTSTTTSKTGTTTTTNAQGTTTSTKGGQTTTFPTLQQLQNTFNAASQRLATDQARLGQLVTERNGLQAQIKKLGG